MGWGSGARSGPGAERGRGRGPEPGAGSFWFVEKDQILEKTGTVSHRMRHTLHPCPDKDTRQTRRLTRVGTRCFRVVTGQGHRFCKEKKRWVLRAFLVHCATIVVIGQDARLQRASRVQQEQDSVHLFLLAVSDASWTFGSQSSLSLGRMDDAGRVNLRCVIPATSSTRRMRIWTLRRRLACVGMHPVCTQPQGHSSWCTLYAPSLRDTAHDAPCVHPALGTALDAPCVHPDSGTQHDAPCVHNS